MSKKKTQAAFSVRGGKMRLQRRRPMDYSKRENNVLQGISPEKNRLYFLGIGGVSMSALADLAARRGYTVAGSDRTDSAHCERLRQRGITVDIGHDAKKIGQQDVIIYNAAIAADNPQFLRAKELGLRMIYRTDFLAALMSGHKNAVGIAGMHGKSTTSAMLSHLFLDAGRDPSILIGAELAQIQGAYHLGQGDDFIFEACEYRDSFLSLQPSIAVVLNAEMDHPDYFHDIDQVCASFHRYLNLPGRAGYAVVNADCANTMRAAQGIVPHLVSFGIEQAADFRAVALKEQGGFPSFTVLRCGQEWCRVQLRVGGHHNIYNALACCVCADLCGIEKEAVRSGLESFTGAHRRMEYKGRFPGRDVAVYDDFGHHPTEVLSTLRGARALCRGRLFCVFQPHTYSRTKALFDDFTKAFAPADETFFVDIYAAREPFDASVSAAQLAAATPHARYFSDYAVLTEALGQELMDGDMLVIMGAGDIEAYAKRFEDHA